MLAFVCGVLARATETWRPGEDRAVASDHPSMCSGPSEATELSRRGVAFGRSDLMNGMYN